MSIKFIHIRPGVRYDTEAKKLVGTPESKGGITIAYTLDSDHSIIRIAVAQCHRRDAYSRSIGRSISAGRLMKQPHLLLNYDDTRGLVEQVVDATGSYCLAKFLEEICNVVGLDLSEIEHASASA